MRGTRLPAAPSRIKGRHSLVRRLRKLILATYAYGCHRAATPSDIAFSHCLYDHLIRTLDAVDAGREDQS